MTKRKTARSTNPRAGAGDGGGSASVYTTVQLAALIGVCVNTLRSAARRGEVPCRRVGRRYIFARGTIDAWLAAGGRS